MYYPCRENKGADQLHSNREADQPLCFCLYANCWFSHEAAHFSPFARRLDMNFAFDWQIGFMEDV